MTGEVMFVTGEVMFVTGSVTKLTGETLQAINGPEKCPEMTGRSNQ